jgi:UDP-galactopyranose mutase
LKPVAIVGAGWAGATVAHQLNALQIPVEVLEASTVVGGASRIERINGVAYEPNGAHIFHTSNREVAELVRKHGLRRRYRHSVLTSVYLGEDDEHPRLLSWPPQVDELRVLPIWGQVARELEDLPSAPSGDDFETYVISMMGETLYRLFIRDYTTKQWGRDPRTLSSSFAPRRVDLRRDGDRRLFHDRWEYFHPRGAQEVIESLLQKVSVTCGAQISIRDLDDIERNFSGLVLTAALDEFLDSEERLEWRGIAMRSRYSPVDDSDKITAAYVINHPSSRVPYTRTVETKWATGQVVPGTIVSEEYPGSPARHYPVPTIDQRNEHLNQQLQTRIEDQFDIPVWFCGRLASYRYINQDQAILSAMECANEVGLALS